MILLLVLLAAADAGAHPKENPNAKFLKPDLDVPSWVQKFESPGREVYDKRKQIVAAAHLRKGAAVADVGAGTGLYTMLFSQEVGPEGTVYAVEIAPRFLDYLPQRARKTGARNVKVVKGTDTSVELPPASVDLVFLCDTYHHFEQPQKNLASIRKALRPGGELLIVDFKREPGKTAAWITEHVRAGEAAVTAEIEAAGFTRVEELPLLKDNYVLRFRSRR
jgi:ubiquinone/menaquinone biosynthesis C-methylase UbiE